MQELQRRISSIVSGWNHSALQVGHLTVPRLPSGMRNFRLQTGHTVIAKISSRAAVQVKL